MSSVPNRVLAAVVGVVVLLAVVAGVVASRRTAPVLDRGTPEGVTQAYLEAVLDEDHQAAADLLSPDSTCDLTDVVQGYLPEAFRVALGSTSVDGDSAVVTLRVTDRYDDGPFGSSEYTHTERVTLVRDDGTWLIVSSPWLLPSCGVAKG